ncbi:acyltransferase [Micrococcales bacterium 31B]|nr:acyltransferase [Micrococcales bacterium 31B]
MNKSAPAAHTGHGFRLDIQGLRAIAVTVVVAFHAGVTWIPGGFIGVDMFFVISGFLICGAILSEMAGTDTFRFRRFFVRRLRRLYPAALLVIVATLVAVYFFAPAQKFRDYSYDAITSMLYVSNFRFAFGEFGYFADTIASPFQHLWSLSVEEQFYVTLAILLILLRSLRQVKLARVIFAMTLVSLVVSIIGAIFFADISYYVIFTRGWEFGVGCLIAVAARRLVHLGRAAATTLRVLGILLIAASLVYITEDMPFPSYLALGPTLGTAFIIAAGCAPHRDFITYALAWKPFTALGNISYSLYLWHWPALIVPALYFGAKLTPWYAAAAVLASFVLAIFTHAAVESPLRLRSGAQPRILHNVATATVLTLAVTAGAFYGMQRIDQQLTNVSSGGQTTAATVQDIGISVPTPTPTETDESPTPEPTPIPTDPNWTPVGNLVFPPASALTPAVADAAAYRMQADIDGCLVGLNDTTIKVCEYGVMTSEHTIMLFGDSHAEMLYPAYAKIASTMGWKLQVLTKSACAPSTMRFGTFTGTAAQRQSCYDWREAAVAKIHELQPDLIVMAGYQGDTRRTMNLAVADFNSRWVTGLNEMVAQLPATSQKLFVSDTPDWTTIPVSCISRNTNNYSVCNNSIGNLVSTPRVDSEKATLEAAGVTVMNLNNVLCPEGVCAVIDRNYVVYKDAHHLLGPYVEALSPYFWLGTQAALQGGEPDAAAAASEAMASASSAAATREAEAASAAASPSDSASEPSATDSSGSSGDGSEEPTNSERTSSRSSSSSSSN